MRLQAPAATTTVSALQFVQRPHLDSGPDLCARGGCCAADRLDKQLRVDATLVRVVHGTRERAGQRGLELPCSVGVEHRMAEARGLGLARTAVQPLRRRVDVQGAGALEARAQLHAELCVQVEALDREDPRRSRALLPVPCGKREPRQPGQDGGARAEVERAVPLEHPPQPVSDRDRVRDRRRMARADQPGVPRRAARCKRGAPLEHGDAGSAAGELERAAGADRATADDNRRRSSSPGDRRPGVDHLTKGVFRK